MTEPTSNPRGANRLGGVPSDALAAVRADHACFGCGADNPIGLRLRFAADEHGVSATFVPGPEHQGFEGVVHGGIISTILDEAMAWATAAAGIWAVTAEMQVRFRRPLHVGDLSLVEARVTSRKGRAVKVVAELSCQSEGLVATATATFMEVAPDVAEAWRARYLEPAKPLGRQPVAEQGGDRLGNHRSSDHPNANRNVDQPSP